MATAPQPNDDSDVRLTPTMRAYLGAFDDFLFAPSGPERQYARAAMGDLCDDLLDEAGLPRRNRAGALSSEDEREARTSG